MTMQTRDSTFIIAQDQLKESDAYGLMDDSTSDDLSTLCNTPTQGQPCPLLLCGDST